MKTSYEERQKARERKMSPEDRKKIKEFDKEIQKKLELYHRIRSTPYSYHRVGKIVGMETKATKKEIEQDRKRVRKLFG